MELWTAAIKNPKSTFGAIGLVAHVLYLLFGMLSAGGGLASIDFGVLAQAVAEGMAAFGLLAARDSNKSSEAVGAK